MIPPTKEDIIKAMEQPLGMIQPEFIEDILGKRDERDEREAEKENAK